MSVLKPGRGVTLRAFALKGMDVRHTYIHGSSIHLVHVDAFCRLEACTAGVNGLDPTLGYPE